MLIKDYPFIRMRLGDVARPYLPVSIVNPENNKLLNVFALVDTGADECALPASFALPLSHDLQSGRPKKVSTGNGMTIAYGHTVCIKIFDFSTDNVLMDFMPNLRVPLLGVKNFLCNFVLNIDYPKKLFSVLKK